MRISLILSIGSKGPCIAITRFYQNFSYYHPVSFFGLKLSLIVILTNFSHSSNSSKLSAHGNLQFYSNYFLHVNTSYLTQRAIVS